MGRGHVLVRPAVVGHDDSVVVGVVGIRGRLRTEGGDNRHDAVAALHGLQVEDVLAVVDGRDAVRAERVGAVIHLGYLHLVDRVDRQAEVVQ